MSYFIFNGLVSPLSTVGFQFFYQLFMELVTFEVIESIGGWVAGSAGWLRVTPEVQRKKKMFWGTNMCPHDTETADM